MTVIKKAGVDNRRYLTWLCKCDCGSDVIVRGSNLRNGNTKSCGCIRKERTKMLNFVTGLTKSRLHRIWSGMKTRCYNDNALAYKDYGGRGIAVCEEWKYEFKPFHDWAMSHGYSHGLTIDRIDNNGNYCPENCRWVTMREQSRNTRRTKFITHNGESHCVAEWAEKYNISPGTLNSRINLGWDMELALITPVKH